MDVKGTTKRPDSLKVELLTLPENGRLSTYGNFYADGINKGEVNVGFKDLSYTVREGLFRRKPRKLLDKINGEFSAGELTAIMGPSGSGKSTLMNILAGYTTSGVTGQRLVNDEIREENTFRNRSCYIMQDDHLEPLLTVYEAMNMAADLKLSSQLTTKEKQTKVKEILESLNLWKHRKVKTESLSGGQKKRLSIALELLKNPQVMFFDEPTSGLDSVASKQCVMLLKELAQTGRTILCTIHQPSASIFEMFDHLYVLCSGKCVYQGSVKGLLPYLEEVNLTCPQYHNPADYLLEVTSGEYGDYSEQLTQKSENGLNLEWRKRQRDSFQIKSEHIDRVIRKDKIAPLHALPLVLPKVNGCDNKKWETSLCYKGTYPTSCLRQLFVLLKRKYLILSRDKTLTYSRLGTHAGIALFIGILYYGIGRDASNMLNNFNLMFFSVMFLMLTAFNCVTTTFPSELPIITREHFNKWYSLKSYYLAISLADIPIQILATLIYATVTYFLTMQPVEPFRLFMFLFMCILISLVAQSFGLLIGASMDIKNGVIFGPFCFLPFTIFSGFFVQLKDCHPYMQWIFHISFLKYGFEGLVLSVLGYDRPKLPCKEADYCHFVYPKKFLDEMSMDQAQYYQAVTFLIGLFILIRLSAYFILKLQINNARHKRTA